MQFYSVTGMSCAACAARVERAVLSVDGVTTCAVNLLTHTMSVDGSASPDAVIAAVVAAGYGAALRGAEKNTPADSLADRESVLLLRRLILSLPPLLLLMYLSMGHVMWGWWLPAAFASSPLAIAIAEWGLATMVAVVNRAFFIRGYRALWHRAPNMDTLIAIGATVAYLYSVYLLFTIPASPTHALHGLYFESAAMILTLITVGKLLESRAKGRATNALRALMRLAPDTATLLCDGEEVTVPLSEVSVGDLFIVRPGDRIPTDGEVVRGESAVDESLLTGESLPIDKGVGASVYAATINRSGVLTCRATSVGEKTALAQIIRTVADASATKAPIARVADRVSAIFVPVVMGIAAVTIAAWLAVGASLGEALSHGIAVLVISCPCALGLATPVAIMVGSGVGAKRGILFKTAAALESAGRIRSIALDKTGTLTEGVPHVTDILPARGVDKTTLLSYAAAAEWGSEHPLADAVKRRAEEENLAPPRAENFTALAGSGVSAIVEGATIIGGSVTYISALISLDEEYTISATRLSEEGKTPLVFIKDDIPLGLIAVADLPRPDSKAAVSALRRMGITTIMLTGDNTRTAQVIGREIGVDRIVAEVKPNEKEAVISALRTEGTVAMVGDGINDAPALARADLGIAIGSGTDVSIDAADIVLMNSRAEDIVTAASLGRATLTNIRENLFWAFFYNCIGIPLAAGVFTPLFGWSLSPMFGAAAMSLSSFCVVMNALRLNLFRPRMRLAKHSAEPCQPGTPSCNLPLIQEKETSPMTKTLYIEGMMCPRCEAHVKHALESVDGVTSAVADHTAGTAVVTLSHPVDDAALTAVVTAADYTVARVE